MASVFLPKLMMLPSYWRLKMQGAAYHPQFRPFLHENCEKGSEESVLGGQLPTKVRGQLTKALVTKWELPLPDSDLDSLISPAKLISFFAPINRCDHVLKGGQGSKFLGMSCFPIPVGLPNDLWIFFSAEGGCLAFSAARSLEVH